MTKTQDEAATDVALQFSAIFEVNVVGRKVLEHLERRFCSRPTVVVAGGIDAVLQTYQRAAHREVLDYIHKQLARANGELEEKPLTETGEAIWKTTQPQ